MTSVLTLALALALKHFHSSACVCSSEVNGDVCVCKAEPRQVSRGAEPLVIFGK